MNFRLNTLRARYSEEDRANLSASVNCTLLFLVLLGASFIPHSYSSPIYSLSSEGIYICTYVGTTYIYGRCIKIVPLA